MQRRTSDALNSVIQLNRNARVRAIGADEARASHGDH
jgi:hypothetical protein